LFPFFFFPWDDAYLSGGVRCFFSSFSCAFFVVHEEAMHMTSTPGFGVNCFFPFIFSLVFLTLGLFVIPRKFQVFFCYYLLYTHTQRQKQTQTNTNTNKHTHTHTHAHTRTHTHTHAHTHSGGDRVAP
jgi:ABC-type nickel/cobalt efflux system permease component RcnA